MSGTEVKLLLVIQESHKFYGLVKSNFEKFPKKSNNGIWNQRFALFPKV